MCTLSGGEGIISDPEKLKINKKRNRHSSYRLNGSLGRNENKDYVRLSTANDDRKKDNFKIIKRLTATTKISLQLTVRNPQKFQ